MAPTNGMSLLDYCICLQRSTDNWFYALTYTYSNKLFSFKLYTGGFLKVSHVKILFV